METLPAKAYEHSTIHTAYSVKVLIVTAAYAFSDSDNNNNIILYLQKHTQYVK